jgi:signal transduction histidine kinase
VVDDITDRQRAERAVKELGARMLMVQEAERRRVARELHDDFSQRLALLAIDLEQLSQQSTGNRPEWGRRLRAMWSQTQELTSDIHRLSHQLHPAKLEDLGLVMAVRSFCNEVARQTNVAVEFSDVNVPRFLPSEISLCLYRIVQEALRNVVKHSGSKTAAVKLSMGTGEIRLTISDSGKGFDLEVAKGGEGLGLVSMVERARFAGGDLSINSVPDGGTQVEVRIPLPSPATAQ